MIETRNKTAIVRASFAVAAVAASTGWGLAFAGQGDFTIASIFALLNWDFAFPAAFAGCWLIAFPIHVALDHLGWRSGWAYFAVGLVPAIALLSLLLLETRLVSELGKTLANADATLFLTVFLNAALAPPLAAMTFWAVVRPDKAIAAGSDWAASFALPEILGTAWHAGPLDGLTRKGMVSALFAATAVPVFLLPLHTLAAGGGLGEAASTALGAWAFAFPLAGAGCWLVGLPAHLLASDFGLRSRWAYLAVGALISGSLVWILLQRHGMLFGSAVPFVRLEGMVLACILLAGPVAAFTFWSVARPDRTSPRADERAT